MIGVDYAELEARRAGVGCCSGKTHFNAVVGRDRNHVADSSIDGALFSQDSVCRADQRIRLNVLVGLVLQDDRKLEAVAEIEETGGGWTSHEGQARGQVRFAGAETLASGNGDHHDPVAGEIVGQRERYARTAVAVGTNFGREEGQGVEVEANADGLSIAIGSALLFSHFIVHRHLSYGRRLCGIGNAH